MFDLGGSVTQIKHKSNLFPLSRTGVNVANLHKRH
jgi:hypothetical protein